MISGRLETRRHLEGVHGQARRRSCALEDIDLHVERGRVRLHRRRLGLRQVDAAEHRRRPHGADRRRGAARRRAGRSARARTAASSSRPTRCSLAHRRAEHRLRARSSPACRASEIDERVDHYLGVMKLREVGGRAAEPALRRHAPARRDRALAGDGAGGAAARRAVRRARCAHEGADAGLPALALARDRHDHPHGHARRRGGALPRAAHLRALVAPGAREARDRRAVRRARCQRSGATSVPRPARRGARAAAGGGRRRSKPSLQARGPASCGEA